MSNTITIPDIYVAPDGKVYQRQGVNESELPVFAINSNGELVYRYSDGQVEYEFTVDENGDLHSEHFGDLLEINSDGTINTNTTWTLVTESGASAEMQKKIDLLRTHNKRVKLKVTLLNENYQEVDSLIGRITGYPSYDINGDSDIRRTCNITLSVSAKEQIQLDFEKTWNKRMVELACGLYDWDNSEYTDDNGYVWFKLGRMLMTNGESTFNATTQEIKLNLVDLMAAMTEERGSQIGETYIYQAGNDPKQLIEAVVAENTPFANTSVCEFDDTYPYDESSGKGDYAIDVLRLIFDLFPYYEFFYNTEGTFVVQKIPMKISDPIDISKEVLDGLLISEHKNIDFSQIKNTTEIWGRSLTSDYVVTECSFTGDTYNATISELFTELVSGEKYTLVAPIDSVVGQKMKIQTTDAHKIYTVNGAGTVYTPISAGEMKAGVAYVLRYYDGVVENETTGGFILEGEMQIRVIVQEITAEPSASVKQAYKESHSCNNVKWIVNPDSPFACTINSITGEIQGEIRQVLEGGEYDGIYTTQLAYERASYENWLKCRKQDTVDIETILIPWIDVNTKIEYTSPVSGEVGVWLVKSVSFDFSDWTMNVKASRFYPYYPFIDEG